MRKSSLREVLLAFKDDGRTCCLASESCKIHGASLVNLAFLSCTSCLLVFAILDPKSSKSLSLPWGQKSGLSLPVGFQPSSVINVYCCYSLLPGNSPGGVGTVHCISDLTFWSNRTLCHETQKRKSCHVWYPCQQCPLQKVFWDLPCFLGWWAVGSPWPYTQGKAQSLCVASCWDHKPMTASSIGDH